MAVEWHGCGVAWVWSGMAVEWHGCGVAWLWSRMVVLTHELNSQQLSTHEVEDVFFPVT